ncbi:MAG: MFS transporter, partial [Alkalispirochaeta sp.]
SDSGARHDADGALPRLRAEVSRDSGQEPTGQESTGQESTGQARSGVAADGASLPSERVPPGRLRIIGVGSVAIFFLYTGLEVVAGQWAFSLFTIERGMSATRAGTWVGLYWAALTVGRIVFGWVSERVATVIILRGALGGAVVGTLLLFPSPVTILAPVGLALLGFSLAPIFPLLIGETPRRIGARRANHLIGFQIAAANIGAVSFIAAVGVAVEAINLEVVPWALAIVLILFIVIHEMLLVASARQS